MNSPSDRGEHYEICIVGHLAPRWQSNFAGMTVVEHDDGTSVISGPVADQSALHGLIRRLADLGLALVSVRPASDEHNPSTRRSTS